MFMEYSDYPEVNPYICQICGLIIWSFDPEWFLEWLDAYDADGHPEGLEEDEEALGARLKWLSDLRLLCDPDDEFGQLLPSFTYDGMFNEDVDMNDANIPAPRPRSQASDIEIHLATEQGGPKFGLKDQKNGDYRDVTMFWGRHHTTDRRVYVVTHAACLEMAKKVFASSRIAHVRDMRGLFTALRWRQGISRKCVNTDFTNRAAHPKVNYTLTDHNYYMPGPDSNWAFRELLGLEWPGPYDSTRANLFYTLAKSPLEIDDLTNTLLRNLQPCRSAADLSADSMRMAEGLARMPPEILDAIFLEMGRDLPRRSSRVLSQKHWKEQLKLGSKGLLPWLWDIDADLVDQKDAEKCPGGPDFEWDWELLVRQLTRGVDYGLRPGENEEVKPNPDEEDKEHWWIWNTVGTGYHTDLAHVPAGLHNRRRIWQLMEEMFVGDTLPEPELSGSSWDGARRHRPSLKKDWVLWWDKSGALLPSPIWIPCIHIFRTASGREEELGLEYTFGRRIGGEIFVREHTRPPQYWRGKGCSEASAGEDEQGVTVEQIYAVLRPLGYPV